MKVGLIDVDSAKRYGKPFPNLALMKIAAFHRQLGDTVEMALPLARYDRVYASKVFDFTPDLDYAPMCDEFLKGGTGYGVSETDCLPYEVEHIMPDYSLYDIWDTAYGFLTRGCPRGCPFCIVSKKEGRASRKVANLTEWWRPELRNIKLLDPNILACPEWADLLGQLAESGAWVDISQGVDIRLMTEEKAKALNRIKLSGIHFAWDGHEDLTDRFKMFAEITTRRYAKMFGTVYCLVNYDSDMDWNLHRIYTLRDLGYDPYVMIYDKKHAPLEIRMLQRWVNNRFVFKKCKRFEDYHR